MFSGCVFPIVVMICTSGPLQNRVICLKTITWATRIRWVSSLHTDYINTVVNAVNHCSDDLCGIMKFSLLLRVWASCLLCGMLLHESMQVVAADLQLLSCVTQKHHSPRSQPDISCHSSTLQIHTVYCVLWLPSVKSLLRIREWKRRWQ